MGRPLASAPAPKDVEGNAVQRLQHIPEDPPSQLLTVAGAPLLDAGKIDLSFYEELKEHFSREPLAAAHPDPARPGVRGDEEVPKGMRMWDDVKALRDGQNGAGWIAAYTSRREPKKERWFNIQTCGSWRLAFLLARLQLRVWQQGRHGPTAKDLVPSDKVPEDMTSSEQAVSAKRITKKRKVEDSEVLAEVQAPQPETIQAPEPEEQLPRSPPKPLVESSARLRSLLERVRAKEAGKDLSLESPMKLCAPVQEPSLSKKVSMLLAAAGDFSSPKKRREREEPGSGEKLAKMPRV